MSMKAAPATLSPALIKVLLTATAGGIVVMLCVAAMMGFGALPRSGTGLLAIAVGTGLLVLALLLLLMELAAARNVAALQPAHELSTLTFPPLRSGARARLTRVK
jgi:hypothetical protein